ncbi:MAG: hypothetical protein ACRDRI_00015 [Pseudonocardiaceae bacterium]
MRLVIQFLGIVLFSASVWFALPLVRRVLLLTLRPGYEPSTAIAVLGLFLSAVSAYTLYMLTLLEKERLEIKSRVTAVEELDKSLRDTQTHLEGIDGSLILRMWFNSARLSAYVWLEVALAETPADLDVTVFARWMDLNRLRSLVSRHDAGGVFFDLEELVSMEEARPGRISELCKNEEMQGFFQLGFKDGQLKELIGADHTSWMHILTIWNRLEEIGGAVAS